MIGCARFWSCFWLLALASRGCEAHRHDCVHNQVAKQAREREDPERAAELRVATAHLNAPTTREMEAERLASGRKLLQTSNAQNLRMHAEYMLESVDATFARILQEQVVPRAIRALSRALQLRAPVSGNLKLPRTCSSILTNTQQCARVGEMCWGDLPSQVSEDFYGETEVCGGTGCETLPGGDGIPDADFAVFVSAYQSNACSPTTGAHAVTCSRDSENWYGLPERPLVGYINFCPPTEGENVEDVKVIDGLVDTATHELIHTLFMSSNLYEHYITSDGRPLGATLSGVVATPAVRQATRDHFNCPTAEGAPLEQDGGDATSGSHWESTTFQSEIMIGASAAVERRVLSPITLGLAQDSGWYVPNWEAQGFLRHGHQESCSALDESSPAEQFYCDANVPPACLYSEKSSWCTDTSLTDCPILQPLNNGDCKNPANMLSRLSSTSATEVGIYYGPQAICIGVPNGQLSRGFRTWPIDDACVASRCEEDGSLSVLIKEVSSDNFKPFPCPEGDVIELGVSDGFAPDTQLGPCPPASDVCPYKGCPVKQDLMCSLQGNCFEQKCYCAVDKSGEDCSQTLCDSDQGCLDGQFCSENHECTWGTAPPPPPPGTGTTEFVSDFGRSDFKSMRAVRVGYLQQCVFFEDANGDSVLGLSSGEKSQPSGPKGEVSLYVEGETETTQYTIRQDAIDAACQDTLTEKKGARMLFSVAAGVPVEETTIGPLSTAVALEMAARNLSRSDAAQEVGVAFGVPASAVHSKDWLQVMTTPGNDDERDQAIVTGLVSAASVLTIEQIAALLAGDELQVGYNVSNAVMRQLVAPEGGDVLTKVQDSAWLTSAMASAAETAEVPAPDAAAAQAVADAIVLVNTRLIEVRDTMGAGDAEELLVGWAKAAHVGDVMFAESAAQLGAGEMEETQFRNRTSPQALKEGEATYNPDLSDATLLEDPSFFDNARESIQEWLRSTHYGLYGWLWAALGVAALFVFCFACSFCTNWSKRRKAQKAVRRALDSHLTVHSAPRAQHLRQPPVGAIPGPARQASRGRSPQMPSGWEQSPRDADGVMYPPPGYPDGVMYPPPGYPPQQTEIYSAGYVQPHTQAANYAPSRNDPARGYIARNDPLAAPAF